MTCGVYIIRHRESGKFYIGSSNNIDLRKSYHEIDLKMGRHFNPHLQNAWNKYGADAFEFEILEECLEKDQFVREQFYLDTLPRHLQYNISRKAGKPDNRASDPEVKKRRTEAVQRATRTPEARARASERAIISNLVPGVHERRSRGILLSYQNPNRGRRVQAGIPKTDDHKIALSRGHQKIVYTCVCGRSYTSAQLMGRRQSRDKLCLDCGRPIPLRESIG